MYFFRKQILICTASHCAQKGAQQVAGRLRIELKRQGLDAEVLANTCDSIDLCDIGPNLVVYPDGIIYHGVTVRDIPELIESLRPGGEPVERLRLRPRTGAEEVRRTLYQRAGETQPLTPERFEALAVEAGFGPDWINEQARRGFIARKEHDGQPLISITSKARNRYGLPPAE